MGFMDWLRRNWPDLLIGVALVAVIAGIIATLISGGSFFPFGQGGGSTPSTPITGSTTPGVAQPGTTQPGTTQPGTTQPGTTQPGTSQPGTTPEQTGGATATDPTTSGSEQTGTEDSPIAPEIPTDEGIAVLPPPGTPSGTASTPGATPTTPATPSGSTSSSGGVTALPPAGSTPSAPSATTPTTPAPTTPSAPTSTSAPSGTPVAASAGEDESSYRVSVGAFGNADNAQRLAEQFQGAGYPVLLGSQGNLTIVLLGPYATDSEARQVANQVDGTLGVVDPTVYRFEPEEGVGSAPAATTPAAQPAAPAAATPAATPATTAPTASATGRYLQVGAYANRESSLPQRERLEGMGFTVTEAQEGDLLKLLVGPYQGTSLSDAQSRLAAEGIENFARGL